MGFRVITLSQQLSPSGSGVRCSQSPCSSPRPLCHAALDHSVLEAGAQGGTCPSVGPCLQEKAPIHMGSKPLVGPASAWFHKHFCLHGEQGQCPRMSKMQKPRERACTKLQSPVPRTPTPVSTISVGSPVVLTLFQLPFLANAKVFQPCTGIF